MKRWLIGLSVVAIGLTGALANQDAAAQAYPSKPIKIIVPFPPGGPTDVFARVVGQQLNEAWGQPVVPDNKPGATGTLGTSLVVKSPPDGYTLLMAATSSHIAPYLYQTMAYDPNGDLQPVINVVTTPLALVSNPKFPAKNVKELVAELKARPGFYAFGSTGSGGVAHLVWEMFMRAAGLKLIHVPYKGAAPELTAVVAGEVMFAFDTIQNSHTQIEAGRLHAYAVTGAARAKAMPDLPTLQEAGYPDFEAYIWFGLFAPKGTPSAIVNKLNREVTRIMATPTMRQRLADVAGEFAPNTPEQFHAFAVKDSARWQEIIAETGARAE